MADVKMVRIYLTEADKLLNAVISYLHNEANVQGVTVLRAVAGFSSSGVLHNIDAPANAEHNLPMMLEFFDESQKADRVVEHLKTMVGANHIISWLVSIA